MRHPIHAEKHRRTVEAVAAEEVDDGDVGRSPVGTLRSAQVDGELRRFVQFFRKLCLHRPTGYEPSALQRDQSALDKRLHLRKERLDLLAPIDGYRNERQVFGERQKALRVQLLLDPEAFGRPEENGGLHVRVVEQAHERVRQQLTTNTIALA